uniref:Fucosyltransferase n=1 Tax=Haemonchus contortus TaxID=6289 RepID=A0A7I4Y314_HAECO
MRIRPASLYRNTFFILGSGLLLYALYCLVSYDDKSHVDVHRRQKHLYLTVSKDRIGHRFEKLAPKRILMWTKVFREEKKIDFSDCKGFSDRCIATYNKSLIGAADAVVFHAADIADGPLPDAKDRRPNQRYVFLSMEAPHNSGFHAVPLNFFNWTATYLLSSDVVFKYGVYFLPAKVAEEKGFKFTDFHVDYSFPKKKSGILGFISNCNTSSKRELALRELSKYMNVTIGGKCASNRENVNLCPSGQDCTSLYSDYPFYLAVENSVCKDYVSEKYWERLSVPSIPIVMRRKVFESLAIPPHSFIAMDDYASPKEMAADLIRLESDRKAYAEYFAWRNGGWTAAPWNAPGYRNGYCRLCERLWEENQEPKVIPDVWTWFKSESQCEGADFVKNWIGL